MSSTFGHRIEPPHPDGLTPPAAQNDESAPVDLDSLSRAAADVGGRRNSLSAEWWGYGLAVLTSLVALYDIYRPSMAVAAVLLALPLGVMASLLQSPRSFEVYPRGGGARLINVILFVPFSCLLLPNFVQPQVNPMWPLIPAVVTGLAMLASAWTLKGVRASESPVTFVVFVGLFGALYGYGATSLADIQFDVSNGQVTPLPVMDRYQRCGRSCSYHIELPAAEPRAQAGWVTVSSGLYSQLHKGDTVCQVSHPGALTLPWYRVGPCKTGGTDWRQAGQGG